MTLAEVTSAFPPEHGLAEVVAYLRIAGHEGAAVDESVTETTGDSLQRSTGAEACAPAARDLYGVNVMDAAQGNELPSILVGLLKGVVYREQAPALWRDLLNLQGAARDHLRLLGLDLIIDEAEGYAFLRQSNADAPGSEEQVPRLIPRRPLSYPVSLLLVLLRKRLAQHDARGGETRLVLSREQIVDMLRTFLASGTNEAKVEDQIERHVARVEELGFVRRMKEDEDLYEVRRILRAFVNADWLADLEAVYRDHAQRPE